VCQNFVPQLKKAISVRQDWRTLAHIVCQNVFWGLNIGSKTDSKPIQKPTEKPTQKPTQKQPILKCPEPKLLRLDSELPCSAVVLISDHNSVLE